MINQGRFGGDLRDSNSEVCGRERYCCGFPRTGANASKFGGKEGREAANLYCMPFVSKSLDFGQNLDQFAAIQRESAPEAQR